MSIEEGFDLSRALEGVLERTGVRVVVVIAETTQPEPIEAYGERLARRWRRERQLDVERSIFIVLAVRDREMQVMPGKAFPHIERDLESTGTLRELPPLFRAGRYFEALMKLNAEIDRLIRKHDRTTFRRDAARAQRKRREPQRLRPPPRSFVAAGPERPLLSCSVTPGETAASFRSRWRTVKCG